MEGVAMRGTRAALLSPGQGRRGSSGLQPVGVKLSVLRGRTES